MQTEYEQDCGVTFGKIPAKRFCDFDAIVDGVGVPLGGCLCEDFDGWWQKGLVGDDGKIKPTFDPKEPGLDLGCR